MPDLGTGIDCSDAVLFQTGESYGNSPCAAWTVFLVIGLIAVICNRKAKPYPFIVLVFPLVGIALLVCGIYILTKGEIALSMLDQYAPYILIWIFPLAGIMMIAGTLGKIRYLKQVCTQEVQAKCVDIESASAAGTHRRKHVTMPVYSISYNGEEKLLRKACTPI